MKTLCMLAAWLCAGAVQASTLAGQLEAAWQMAPEARALDARADELKARGVAVDSLLAAPPAVAVSYRGDQFTGNAGQRDIEAELGLPLWLPGQRAAHRSALDAEGLALAAQRAALRLRLAGELREKNAALRRADLELALAETRLAEARALEADVERRLRAGDLARTDFLAARMETLTAQRDMTARQTARDAARAALRVLSGSEQAAQAETLAEAPAAHPDLAARNAALTHARERLRASQQNRREAPELALFGRRERGSASADYDTSLGMRIRLPFATEARNAPLRAQAQGEVTVAQAEQEQAQRWLEADIRQSDAALQSARRMQETATQRFEAASENHRHIRRAFDYGERDLAALLRAKGQMDAARLEAALAALDTEIAISRLNQARGVLP